MNGFYGIAKALEALERRGIITTDPEEADLCCGSERDDDGLCRHRPGHPVYVDLHAKPVEDW